MLDAIIITYLSGFLATLGWVLFNSRAQDLFLCLMVSLFWFFTIPITIFCVVLAHLIFCYERDCKISK